MKNSKKRGFTLIDMLATMAVLSILLGFGFASMKDTTDAANVVDAKSDLKVAISDLSLEFAKTNSYLAKNGDNYKGTGVDITATATTFCVEKTHNAITYRFDLATDTGIVTGTCP